MAESSAKPFFRWKRIFNGFRGFVASSHSQVPLSPCRRRRQRILGGEGEEEFPHVNTRCLSSYYSVFVARLAIMVMLAILIGMLTILTWHFTRVYTTKSINSLAYDLRYELLQRPILRMWNILNSTVEITIAQVKLSEYVISHYDEPVTDAQEVELYEAMKHVTWALFTSRKALNAITIRYINGFVHAFHRDHRSDNTFYIYSELVSSSVNGTGIPEQKYHHGWNRRQVDSNTSAIWYREPLDPVTGKKTGIRSQIPPDDLINIAGMSEIHDGAASWNVTVSKFTDSPLLSAALPVRHPSDKRIMAVVGVTTALYSVGQLMRELVEIHSGYMYLTSQEGYVLATSTDAPLIRNSTSGRKLMMAVDSEDRMIRSGAEWLQKTYGDKFSQHHEIHVENAMLGHHRYYIDSFFLNLKRLPLVGVIILPREHVMGKVDRRGFTTLVILISASVCILAIGCVCILILTSGVSKEMKLRAELISHLDARRRAEASSNYKSQFLANMSHELRTPMAAVIGLLDILICDDSLTNEQFATITQIRKCSTALLRLLNNILDLSKVESGKLVLEEAEFDLVRELEGLVDMFSVQCINHNVETVLDLSDDIPKLVQGDSARVVQTFANLLSNSIKFTSSGHIILRGWCGSANTLHNREFPLDQKDPPSALKTKVKQHGNLTKTENRITLWFEVDDTGCGIDPSKWESVFESFEQADPSTTRTHGGTGLGLCIVRTLVNKMGGEIKVVKKDSPGTLMKLCLNLSTPIEGTGKHFQMDFGGHSLTVLLAINGSTGRFIMSQWLRKNGICTWEASEWNELTQFLQEVFQESSSASDCSTSEPLRSNGIRVLPKELNIRATRTSNNIIVVDAGLLDLSSNIWKEQLNFLDQYHGKAKFAWILNHDTSNAVKKELRIKGHLLMVNKPLYKAKMIQILETVVRTLELQRSNASETSAGQDDLHECLEIDPIHFDVASSDESVISDNGTYDLRSEIQVGGKTVARTLISYLPHYRTVDWRKESPYTIYLDKILQNPGNEGKYSNNFIGSEKYANGDSDTVSSRNGWHKRAIEEKKMGKLEEQSEDPDSQLKNGCFPNNRNGSVGFGQEDSKEEKNLEMEYTCPIRSASYVTENTKNKLLNDRKPSTSGNLHVEKPLEQHSTQRITELACRRLKRGRCKVLNGTSNEQDCGAPTESVSCEKHLEGLRILLAEDTPILQRVATVMLEKLGAKVVVVGDGLQAVDALKTVFSAEDCRRWNSPQQDDDTRSQSQCQEIPPFDLILMDCQMPKLDGYEATKAIRRSEAGTSLHIPIVALTAHAMSSDEAKCLEVGMDAYLTKPIDSKLMVSTILSLTKKTPSV